MIHPIQETPVTEGPHTLFVGNLGELSEVEIHSIFKDFGNIVEIRTPRGQGHKSESSANPFYY